MLLVPVPFPGKLSGQLTSASHVEIVFQTRATIAGFVSRRRREHSLVPPAACFVIFIRVYLSLGIVRSVSILGVDASVHSSRTRCGEGQRSTRSSRDHDAEAFDGVVEKAKGMLLALFGTAGIKLVDPGTLIIFGIYSRLFPCLGQVQAM